MSKYNFEESDAPNYFKYREKIINIIYRCNKKNMKKLIKFELSNNPFILTGMYNVKAMEHYVIDDEINIYKLYNSEGQLIDCLIAEDEIFDNDYSFNKGKTFIEYSPNGGKDNSFTFGTMNYYNKEHYKIIVDASFDKRGDYHPDMTFTENGFYTGNFIFRNNATNNRPMADCDIDQIIDKVANDPYGIANNELGANVSSQYKKIRSLLNKIEIVLNKPNKKSIVAGLLNKFKKVSEDVDAKKTGRGK